MYESTFVKTPSFWYGLNRPACDGSAKIIPAEKAAATSSASRPARRRRDRGFEELVEALMDRSRSLRLRGSGATPECPPASDEKGAVRRLRLRLDRGRPRLERGRVRKK